VNFFPFKQTSPTSSLDQYVPYLPLIGTFFMLYGYIDLVTYYNAFHISIINYIGIGELILYFLKDIKTILIMVIGFLLSMRMVVYFEQNKKEKEAITPAIKKKKKIINLISWVIIGIMAIVYCFIVDADYIMYPAMPIAIWGIAKLCFPDGRLNTLIIILSLGLFFPFLNAKIEAEAVQKGKHTGTNIVLLDRVLPSDSSNYLIGITEKYIFYHQAADETTLAIPINQVRHLELKSRK
jgi:hypothetical protein